MPHAQPRRAAPHAQGAVRPAREPPRRRRREAPQRAAVPRAQDGARRARRRGRLRDRAASRLGGFLLAALLVACALLLPDMFLVRMMRDRAERLSDASPAGDRPDRDLARGRPRLRRRGLVLRPAVQVAARRRAADDATEIRDGRVALDALKELSDRVPSDDMRNFVQTLVQSEGVGISRATILRTQADDLRHRRQLAAEERAQKAPVKMLFPIAIFILPVMFIVILGPAIKQASTLFEHLTCARSSCARRAGVALRCRVADGFASRFLGLMGRSALPAGRAMLFVTRRVDPHVLHALPARRRIPRRATARRCASRQACGRGASPAPRAARASCSSWRPARRPRAGSRGRPGRAARTASSPGAPQRLEAVDEAAHALAARALSSLTCRRSTPAGSGRAALARTQELRARARAGRRRGRASRAPAASASAAAARARQRRAARGQRRHRRANSRRCGPGTKMRGSSRRPGRRSSGRRR